LPSALLREAVFSVEMSPSDSMTTKRPLPLISPANELRAELVTCATKGSGVVWAKVVLGAAVKSMKRAAAHDKRKACFT
jgi:hypothetical protein